MNEQPSVSASACTSRGSTSAWTWKSETAVLPARVLTARNIRTRPSVFSLRCVFPRYQLHVRRPAARSWASSKTRRPMAPWSHVPHGSPWFSTRVSLATAARGIFSPPLETVANLSPSVTVFRLEFLGAPVRATYARLPRIFRAQNGAAVTRAYRKRRTLLRLMEKNLQINISFLMICSILVIFF